MKGSQKILVGVLVLMLTIIPIVSAFSQDNSGSLQKGDIFLNAGLGFGRFDFPFSFPGYSDNNNQYSFNKALLYGLFVSVDYALPINFPLTIGAEIGYMRASSSTNADYAFLSPVLSSPVIMLRTAWHPDFFSINNLDTYLMLKFGYAFGSLTDKYTGTRMEVSTEPSDFGLGLNVGTRYFFGDRFGIFGEIGYERFFTNLKAEAGWVGSDGNFGSNTTIFDGTLAVERYLTFGVTWRL